MNDSPDLTDAAPGPAPAAATPPAESAEQPSRRTLFGLLGAGAAGLAAGAVGGGVAGAALAGAFGGGSAGTASAVAFEGPHQAGITTPAQEHLHFAAFTLMRATGRAQIIELLQEWTEAARALTAGRELGRGAVDGPALAPPDDTGEAQGIGPAQLTLTFGFGRQLFADRMVGGELVADPFGLRGQLPRAFQELPAFAFELLEEAQSGGDLCVQACANDPQVAVHAIRNLTRIAMGRAHLKWSQLGYGRTSSTSAEQQTPRNLFGFKDGTANVMAEEAAELETHVWVGDEGPAWLRGGSYLVARKIAMTIEAWDRVSLTEQEADIGRSKGTGAPLSGGGEFAAPNFDAVRSSGGLAIDPNAHVRLAHPEHNGGARMLRRGYNYVEGSNALGQLGAGLFFLSYQRDPATFVRVQESLKTDRLNEYLRHVGSGLWAVPGGVRPGEYLGQALFQ